MTEAVDAETTFQEVQSVVKSLSPDVAEALREIVAHAANPARVGSAVSRLVAGVTRTNNHGLDLERTKGGLITPTISNVAEILSKADWTGVIARNALTGDVECRIPPPIGGPARVWGDADDVLTRQWIERKHGLSLSGDRFADGLCAVATRTEYHPVRDYLDALQWDGSTRFKRMLRILGISSELEAKALRLWMISAVARVYDPGCKAHLLPIFHGAQGVGKSTTLQILGGPWYGSPSIDPESKDGQIVATRFWLTEIEEIDKEFRARSASAWKAFVSKADDSIRLPYARKFSHIKRTFVFAGSTNARYFLTDPTGARRYPVIHITKRIDTRELERIRDSVWGEIAYAYRSGEQWHPSSPEEGELSRASISQHSTAFADPWASKIVEWLHRNGITRWTVVQALDAIGVECRFLMPAQHERVTMIADALGWIEKDGHFVKVG